MGKKKKEKVIDLKPEKIYKQELEELQNIVTTINRILFDIGTMEAQKHAALHALFQGNEKLTEIQVELEKTYGTNDINIGDGTINYKENEPSDS